MKNMEKREYNGLVTTRMTVESPDIMAISNAKIKAKVNTSTDEWEEKSTDNGDLPILNTTISSSLE